MTSILQTASKLFPWHLSQGFKVPQLLQQSSKTIIISATILAVTVPRIYRNYQTFLSYGPGGPPYNILGWFAVSVIFSPWGRETLSTEVYNVKIAGGETVSYLSDESVRVRKRDRRPEMGPHVAPQRQIDEFPSAEIKEKLNQNFYAVATRNQHLTRLAPSNLEFHADALFLTEGLLSTPAAQQMKGEIAHLHRWKDFSMHVTLAPADCKKVIEAGWGERNQLSGVQLPKALGGGKLISLPLEFLFIYAPRTEAEVAFVTEILVAGVKYMTESVEVR
ncbi:hypothetical protein BDV28DRAFT_160722 [Aspergillus coremiiformis]|uniref:Luciferase domain-containing protein n=1 Tax=Aspergillus coremiiformis TaxID=138285 RepID=A0A5N6YUQ0_9EURO|nr:hypothetical protein BDV28DRAFT_160722 [Aspergillus coremiiformis]